MNASPNSAPPDSRKSSPRVPKKKPANLRICVGEGSKRSRVEGILHVVPYRSS